MITFLRDILVTFVIAALIFFGLQFTVESFIVEGPSMQPGFQNGQRLIVNKIVYRLHEPERGDVIVFKPPNNGQEDYIKRIIGLPGEYVEMKERKVYINKANGDMLLLDEPYIKEQTNKAFRGDKIPENEYFVLGDNRNNSEDSRAGWTLPGENIIGKAWLSIWPPDKWGVITDYSYEGD